MDKVMAQAGGTGARTWVIMEGMDIGWEARNSNFVVRSLPHSHGIDLATAV